ncbi:hypothetical protein AAAX69_15250, partial [Mediterraneibacter gnavus]
HFHYTTHGIEVSFFYAKSRTCSFIVLHAKTPGYRTKLFPSGKPGLVIGLILGSLFLFAAGLLVFFISVARML